MSQEDLRLPSSSLSILDTPDDSHILSCEMKSAPTTSRTQSSGVDTTYNIVDTINDIDPNELAERLGQLHNTPPQSPQSSPPPSPPKLKRKASLGAICMPLDAQRPPTFPYMFIEESDEISEELLLNPEKLKAYLSTLLPTQLIDLVNLLQRMLPGTIDNLLKDNLHIGLAIVNNSATQLLSSNCMQQDKYTIFKLIICQLFSHEDTKLAEFLSINASVKNPTGTKGDSADVATDDTSVTADATTDGASDSADAATDGATADDTSATADAATADAATDSAATDSARGSADDASAAADYVDINNAHHCKIVESFIARTVSCISIILGMLKSIVNDDNSKATDLLQRFKNTVVDVHLNIRKAAKFIKNLKIDASDLDTFIHTSHDGMSGNNNCFLYANGILYYCNSLRIIQLLIDAHKRHNSKETFFLEYMISGKNLGTMIFCSEVLSKEMKNAETPKLAIKKQKIYSESAIKEQASIRSALGAPLVKKEKLAKDVDEDLNQSIIEGIGYLKTCPQLTIMSLAYLCTLLSITDIIMSVVFCSYCIKSNNNSLSAELDYIEIEVGTTPRISTNIDITGNGNYVTVKMSGEFKTKHLSKEMFSLYMNYAHKIAFQYAMGAFSLFEDSGNCLTPDYCNDTLKNPTMKAKLLDFNDTFSGSHIATFDNMQPMLKNMVYKWKNNLINSIQMGHFASTGDLRMFSNKLLLKILEVSVSCQNLDLKHIEMHIHSERESDFGNNIFASIQLDIQNNIDPVTSSSAAIVYIEELCSLLGNFCIEIEHGVHMQFDEEFIRNIITTLKNAVKNATKHPCHDIVLNLEISEIDTNAATSFLSVLCKKHTNNAKAEEQRLNATRKKEEAAEKEKRLQAEREIYAKLSREEQIEADANVKAKKEATAQKIKEQQSLRKKELIAKGLEVSSRTSQTDQTSQTSQTDQTDQTSQTDILGDNCPIIKYLLANGILLMKQGDTLSPEPALVLIRHLYILYSDGSRNKKTAKLFTLPIAIEQAGNKILEILQNSRDRDGLSILRTKFGSEAIFIGQIEKAKHATSSDPESSAYYAHIALNSSTGVKVEPEYFTLEEVQSMVNYFIDRYIVSKSLTLTIALSGAQGFGKTTLMKTLINELILYINIKIQELEIQEASEEITQYLLKLRGHIYILSADFAQNMKQFQDGTYLSDVHTDIKNKRSELNKTPSITILDNMSNSIYDINDIGQGAFVIDTMRGVHLWNPSNGESTTHFTNILNYMRDAVNTRSEFVDLPFIEHAEDCGLIQGRGKYYIGICILPTASNALEALTSAYAQVGRSGNMQLGIIGLALNRALNESAYYGWRKTISGETPYVTEDPNLLVRGVYITCPRISANKKGSGKKADGSGKKADDTTKSNGKKGSGAKANSDKK